jgi:hypothetical protein
MVMNDYNQIKNALVWNPQDHFIYLDDPYTKAEDIIYDTPIMNAKSWFAGNNTGSRTGGIPSQSQSQSESDPLKIVDVFVNNGTADTNFADKATDYFQNLHKARTTRDTSLAAGIITSKHYSVLQDSTVLGENAERILTGVLAGAFESVAVPNISGKWRTFEHDLKWFRNIPEGKSPEPSFGTASEITITVQKHGGAVARTERARDVINGANVYNRLISQLQDLRIKEENAMIAEEIESNTSNSITGIDWGARSSGVSTNNPVDKFNEFRSTFANKSRPADGFVSKWLGYAELFNNDYVKGTNQPIRSVGQGGFEVNEFPILGGITYYADDAISSTTAGWLFSKEAIKIFRGPTRQYTVANPDTESEKYVTKSYMTPETVDSGLIYIVTGITG